MWLSGQEHFRHRRQPGTGSGTGACLAGGRIRAEWEMGRVVTDEAREIARGQVSYGALVLVPTRGIDGLDKLVVVEIGK